MIEHGPAWTIWLIVFCYLIFAFQVWHQAPIKPLKTKGGRAVFALVLVFVLCATAGYAMSLLPETWQTVRDIAHYALAAASVWLVASNQAGAVAKMIGTDG